MWQEIQPRQIQAAAGVVVDGMAGVMLLVARVVLAS